MRSRTQELVSEAAHQDLLDGLVSRYGIPGAALGVLSGDAVTTVSTGIGNVETGVEVTPETIFQIGSITKIFTTTLVMQLVDEGKVDLDRPLRTYLPELRFADERASDQITLRQIFSHTSGLADSQEDTGRGDDCLERYVASLATLPQVAPPGQVFSYSNPGFRAAGRLIEKLRGRTWNAALRERLLDPLGMLRTATLPEEAILQRAAVGHIRVAGSRTFTRAPYWHWPRSSGPSGGIVTAARELLSFARLHLDGGIARRSRILSNDLILEMQRRHVRTPDPSLGDGWGLGWALHQWGGHTVIGHDGSGVGQTAFLRIAPRSRFAVCLLTNASGTEDVAHDLLTSVFAEVGIRVPARLAASAGAAAEVGPLTGTYETPLWRIRVESQDARLFFTVEWAPRLAGVFSSVERVPLRPVDRSTFLFRTTAADPDQPVVFSDFDEGGRPRYLHWSGRANSRVGP